MLFSVRITGPGVSALDDRRNCYNAHPCGSCDGHLADAGTTQRFTPVFALFTGLIQLVHHCVFFQERVIFTLS